METDSVLAETTLHREYFAIISVDNKHGCDL